MLKKTLQTISLTCIFLAVNAYSQEGAKQIDRTYSVVDTGVEEFYSNIAVIAEPEQGEPFFGQDGHYQLITPSYTNNSDGTISDNVTGLMWQKVMDEKMSHEEAALR